MKNALLYYVLIGTLGFAGAIRADESNSAGDTIDLQYAICEDTGEAAARRLGVEDLAPKVSEVIYYDSQPPKFIQAGLTFRVKIGKSEDGPQSSVKLRFPTRSPQSGAGCEWDRYGSTETFTCDVKATEINEQAPWSEDQKKFAAKRANVAWSELVAFGPYPDLTWKTKINGYKFKIDSVNPPAPLRPLIELSVKVPYAERATMAAFIASYLAERGVKLCQLQEPKTLRLFRNMGILR